MTLDWLVARLFGLTTRKRAGSLVGEVEDDVDWVEDEVAALRTR